MRNRSALALGIAVAAGALALGIRGEREARACGGCFHPPTQVASDITDERMMLSVSQTQTTLYDQIRYSGSPTSFAWVLPIHGTVDVGLSADVMFDSIDTMTATQIQAPAPNCASLPSSCYDELGGAENASGAFVADAGTTTTGVTVTKASNVGPYETVQLHATDSSALNNWLTTNGFSIPTAVTPIIDEYVAEGFDFLAMKLLPDAGVQAMRPVRVTSKGASLSLPLRMAAIGTGASVGITLWVVSDGRYEPQNFPFYHIEDSALVWDFNTSSSNYTTLRAQHEAELGGKGWEIESSLDLSETNIQSTILSGGVFYGNGGFGGGITADAGDDYLPVVSSGNDSDGGSPAGDDGGTIESADDVRQDDINALFAGLSGPNVRITRMRSDIAHAAMNVDFVLQASSDQSELSNIRIVTNEVNLQCPIYQDCQVVGTGTPEQSAASAAASNNDSGIGVGGCAIGSRRSRTESSLRFGMLAGALGIVAFQLRKKKRQQRNR